MPMSGLSVCSFRAVSALRGTLLLENLVVLVQISLAVWEVLDLSGIMCGARLSRVTTD